MPTDPTGVVNTPAPASVPVHTRYPHEDEKQASNVVNFNFSQFKTMNDIMGEFGGNIPMQQQQQYVHQSSNVNTS